MCEMILRPDIHLGKRVKYFRNMRGYTQVELAGKAGITQSYIGMIEADSVNPSLKTLHKIAQALELSLSELVKEED